MVVSELPLCSSLLAECPPLDGDCEILARASPPAPERYAHRQQWLGPDGTVSLEHYWSGERSTYQLVRFPGQADCLIDGRRVQVTPADGLQPGELDRLLLSQLLPRLMSSRGRLVLHASAVTAAGGAIGFLGPSGAGKSTLSAYLASTGKPILADDCLVIIPEANGGARALPTYSGSRLSPDTVAWLYPTSRSHKGQKNRVHLPDCASQSALKALFLIESSSSVTCEPIEARERVVQLLRNSFQLGSSQRSERARLLEQLVTLARSVPCYRLAYPRDYERLGEVARLLEGYV